MKMPLRSFSGVVALIVAAGLSSAAELPVVKTVERQPLGAQALRVADALEFLGVPLPGAERKALEAAVAEKEEAKSVEGIQSILDRHCLAGVHIAAKDKLETTLGPAKPELAEQGWRVFLVKVANPTGVKQFEVRAESPNALPLFQRSSGKPDPKVISVGATGKRFLDLAMFTQQPLTRDLSGLEVEYRIVQIYSRDAGRKEAAISFALASNDGKKKEAESAATTILFECAPAVVVRLKVRDVDGKPVMGAFTFRDARGRFYPAMSRRLAPDFGFHPQIYRGDGESVPLQPGKYTVTYTRGPEYLNLSKDITVTASAATQDETFELKRWIHPAKVGWYSGDHHIHAAGCAHYESPTEGVAPEDMMRHVLGEDLNVGCCLSWGPCWYHQKRYFEGKPHALSTPDNILRYDVEVSGFPSSHCGHICLLRLREQDYPGTKLIADWPSWDLPIFKWARSQGGVIGFAHSGWGLQPVDAKDPAVNDLPNYLLPRMDSIGANEYLVDIAHDMCDFISTVDTPSVWELNIWYHTLNCGYRCRISGETDFPCIYGERVGLGRSYVHLDGKLDFDRWCEGIKKGRCYVSDGKSHLLDFAVDGKAVGIEKSEVKLKSPGKVKVSARVAALLEPKPTPETEKIRKTPLQAKPYWDIERSRVGTSRKVPVEVVVNGKAVATKEIEADGKEQEISFDIPIERSSWVCLRVFPSSHTNPIFVLVDDKPIRASKKSAEWCLSALDRCWKQKSPNIREKERQDAEAAYDQARKEYKKVLEESEAP
jgi:hypothetical protein